MADPVATVARLLDARVARTERKIDGWLVWTMPIPEDRAALAEQLARWVHAEEIEHHG